MCLLLVSDACKLSVRTNCTGSGSGYHLCDGTETIPSCSHTVYGTLYTIVELYIKYIYVFKDFKR